MDSCLIRLFVGAIMEIFVATAVVFLILGFIGYKFYKSNKNPQSGGTGGGGRGGGAAGPKQHEK